MLVLMEVFRPAVERFNAVCRDLLGFNPCSDGSVSTGQVPIFFLSHVPLCFNPCSDGSVSTGGRGGVSILVLMEVFRRD